MKTDDIAQKLVAHCRTANWGAAQSELFAADAVSIEAEATPAVEKVTRGQAAIIEKGREFAATIEMTHEVTVSDPLVAESSFACTMSLDVTMKGQPRMQMAELCVYEVKDGKIVSEQFFP